MNTSLRSHCILTETSRETMSGKGREGNKEGKGREFEFSPSIHSSSYVSAEGRDGWMGMNP